MPTKLIKTEPSGIKDIKQPGQNHPPPQHEINPSPLGSYPNMFPRHHGLNVPPQQQLHREEDIRR